MLNKRRNHPSDFVLIENTRDFLLASLNGRVQDPELRAAWRRFHDYYDPVIRRFAGSCGIKGDLCDDVAQNAWVIVIKDLRHFDCDPSKGSFRAWLFLRVRSASVGQMRELNRRREQYTGLDLDEHRAPDLEPSQLFERHWNSVVLDEALDVLEQYVNEVDYKLFIMQRLYGFSVAELVKDSGISESTSATPNRP